MWRDIFFFPRRKDPTPTPRSFPRRCAPVKSEPWEKTCRRLRVEVPRWLGYPRVETLTIPRSSMGLIYLPCSNIIYHYLQKNINHSGKYTSVLWIRPGIFVDSPPSFSSGRISEVIGHASIILWQSGCLGLRVLITAFGGFWRKFRFASFTLEHFLHVPSEPSNLSPLSTVRND